jgi:hypothetical protein
MATVFDSPRAAFDTLTGCQSQFGTAVPHAQSLFASPRSYRPRGPSGGLPTVCHPSLPPFPLPPVGPHASCCRNRGTGQRYPTCLASVLPSWVFPWLMSTADLPWPGGQAILHDVLSSSKPRRAATNSP